MFRTDLAHFLYSWSTIHHTPSVWTWFYCATFSSAVVQGQSSQMSTKAGLFSDVQKCLEHLPHNTGVMVPNLDMPCSNDPTYLVLKGKASGPPNLESALIL